LPLSGPPFFPFFPFGCFFGFRTSFTGLCRSSVSPSFPPSPRRSRTIDNCRLFPLFFEICSTDSSSSLSCESLAPVQPPFIFFPPRVRTSFPLFFPLCPPGLESARRQQDTLCFPPFPHPMSRGRFLLFSPSPRVVNVWLLPSDFVLHLSFSFLAGFWPFPRLLCHHRLSRRCLFPSEDGNELPLIAFLFSLPFFLFFPPTQVVWERASPSRTRLSFFRVEEYKNPFPPLLRFLLGREDHAKIQAIFPSFFSFPSRFAATVTFFLSFFPFGWFLLRNPWYKGLASFAVFLFFDFQAAGFFFRPSLLRDRVHPSPPFPPRIARRITSPPLSLLFASNNRGRAGDRLFLPSTSRRRLFFLFTPTPVQGKGVLPASPFLLQIETPVSPPFLSLPPKVVENQQIKSSAPLSFPLQSQGHAIDVGLPFSFFFSTVGVQGKRVAMVLPFRNRQDADQHPSFFPSLSAAKKGVYFSFPD